MFSRVVTSVTPFLNVRIDIFVKIIGLNLICERFSVGEEKFSVIPICSLNIVDMKVIHQGFTQIRNVHTKTDWLIKVKLCLPHVNGSEVFIEYRAANIVWIGCASFWATLSDDISRISTL